MKHTWHTHQMWFSEKESTDDKIRKVDIFLEYLPSAMRFGDHFQAYCGYKIYFVISTWKRLESNLFGCSEDNIVLKFCSVSCSISQCITRLILAELPNFQYCSLRTGLEVNNIRAALLRQGY